MISALKLKHRRQVFLSFLNQIDWAYLEEQLPLVMENYAIHKTPEVKVLLAKNPRFPVLFIPVSGFWLHLVEVWLGIIDRQAIKLGNLTNVRYLDQKSGNSLADGMSASIPSCGPNLPNRSGKGHPFRNF